MSLLPKIQSYEEFEVLKPVIENWLPAIHAILKRHSLPMDTLKAFPEGSNLVFAYGNKSVLKIFSPVLRGQYDSESLVLKFLHGKVSTPVPHLEFEGEIEGWPYIVMSRLDGEVLENIWDKIELENKIEIMTDLGRLIHEVHSLPVAGLEPIDSHWDQFIEKQIRNCVARHTQMKLSPFLISQIPAYLAKARAVLPKQVVPVLLTGEYTPVNLLMKKEPNNSWSIAGLIDFGDCMLGHADYDLLGPGAFMVQGNPLLFKALLSGYGLSNLALNPELSCRLTALAVLHRHSHLNFQIKIENWQSRVSTLEDLESLLWNLPL